MRELHLIDTNCNNCRCMVRDLDKFKKHKEFLSDHYKKDAAGLVVHVPLKPSLNFGHCSKLNKDVSFIPLTCMPENGQCFEVR